MASRQRELLVKMLLGTMAVGGGALFGSGYFLEEGVVLDLCIDTMIMRGVA